MTPAPTRRQRARQIRRELIHAAGCTEPRCMSKEVVAETLAEARMFGVRIPRSLRHIKPLFGGTISETPPGEYPTCESILEAFEKLQNDFSAVPALPDMDAIKRAIETIKPYMGANPVPLAPILDYLTHKRDRWQRAPFGLGPPAIYATELPWRYKL